MASSSLFIQVPWMTTYLSAALPRSRQLGLGTKRETRGLSCIVLPLRFGRDHVGGAHGLVKGRGVKVAELQRGFLERQVFFQGFFGHLRGLVVADDRVERGDQHQAVAE